MNAREPEAAGGWPARAAIARRDLLEFIRDRRALFITLVMPMAMYPLLALSSALGIRTAITELDQREARARLSLALSGPDAGAFAAGIDSLARRADGRPDGWPDNLVVHLVDADAARRLIDEGAADAWIDVADGTIAGLAGAGTVPIDVRLSTVRAADHRAKDRVMAVMRGMADTARDDRLRRAGLPASLIEPLRIDFSGGIPTTAAALKDVLPTTAAAVLVLLALLTATGAFYPAIDAIAGEKERGTIETLLIAPCTPLDVVVGKFLAVFVVTLATLMTNALSIALTATVLVRVLPAGSLDGLLSSGLTGCAIVTVVAYVGLAAVAAALCLAVTGAARSAKEAQNTLTPVVMLIAALAGSALLPGSESRRWLPAVPFAGQVAVARAALVGADGGMPDVGDGAWRSSTVGIGLATSLLSSAAFAWLLLHLTASLVSNEELLFRGPDAATKGFRRPAPRRSPTAWQGFAAALAGLTALWYAQGFAPADFVPALLAQQAIAVLLPLAAIAWWQRIDAQTTFALRRPGTATGTLAAVVGAVLVGSGLFTVGAAAALAVWGTDVSPEARGLAERLIALVRDNPSWLAVLVLAVMPAVCEELFFRGWLLSAFAGDRTTPRRAVAAVAAQAAVFAAFHLLPERMPQTFALGLVLGWMTLATRSILPAIIAHAAHNATPVLLVANASPDDLSAIELGTASGLPPWATAAAIGCLLGGCLLLAVARRGCSPGKDSGEDSRT
ncbi:MAG: ABC transporter permease subunit [Planctomycetia bacterium]|nr:ABC transporter permease subunit [Planctomycetia bacterium]